MKSLQALCISLLLGENKVKCTNLGSEMTDNLSIPAANFTNQVPVNGLQASLGYNQRTPPAYPTLGCGCQTLPEITCCKFDVTYVYSDPKVPPSGGNDDCC